MVIVDKTKQELQKFGLQKFLSNDLKSSLAHAHIYGELIF